MDSTTRGEVTFHIREAVIPLALGGGTLVFLRGHRIDVCLGISFCGDMEFNHLYAVAFRKSLSVHPLCCLRLLMKYQEFRTTKDGAG